MVKAAKAVRQAADALPVTASPLQPATVESLLHANTWKAAPEPIICQQGPTSKPALFLRGSPGFQ